MSNRGAQGQIVAAKNQRKDEVDEVLSVEWKVGAFFRLPGYWGDFYTSPIFYFNDACWLFRLFPNVYTQHPASAGMMALDLVRKDSGPSRTILFRFGIKGTDGVENKKIGIEEFLGIDSSSGFSELWPRHNLKDQECRLMPDDVFTITCELRRILEEDSGAAGGVSYQDASIQTHDELLTESNAWNGGPATGKARCLCSIRSGIKKIATVKEENQSSEKQEINKVVENIGKLLVSGAISDITVQVGDVKINVNRNILFSRFPGFAVKIQASEKSSSTISVCDCEPDVFREFLYYIYEESVQHLTEQNVFGLYHIASEYLASDLKLQCLAYIQDTLSVQTFCNTVHLALLHEESNLLKLAVDFGTKNIQSIICSVQWRNFNCEHPIEANEILIKCICPQI